MCHDIFAGKYQSIFFCKRGIFFGNINIDIFPLDIFPAN